MATQTVNLPYDTSTVANYKSIMQQYGTALSAFGWVNNNDTGTVNWASVSTLPGNGAIRDWEIWRMNDTAQATFPIFVRFDYQFRSTNVMQITITVGTGSNGSGTITGTGFTNTFAPRLASSLGAANLYACYYSGDAGRFVCLMYEGAAAVNADAVWGFSFERSKDSSGADTDEFLMTVAVNSGSSAQIFSRIVTKTGFLAVAQTRLHFVMDSSGTDNANGTTAACPQLALLGKLCNPLMTYLFVPLTDAGEGASVTANIYGATHTYLGCKANSNNLGYANAGSVFGGNTSCTLIRYE